MAHLRRFDDPSTFLREADEFLATDPHAHDLLYGIPRSLVADPALYDDAWFAVLEHAGRVVATMLRTPPHPLVISRVPVDHLDELVDALLATGEYDAGHELGGIQGIGESGRLLGRAWAARTGCRLVDGMSQRFHVLREVVPPPPAPGRMRPATLDDHELCAAWADAMTTEAGSVRPADLARATRRRIEAGRVHLWIVDGKPVAMAVNGRDTPAGAGVNLVYTPPDLRRRGNATHLVAALSQHLLDRGHETCFLYTDLANPTSNSIYAKVGYEPLFDPVQLHFRPAAGT